MLCHLATVKKLDSVATSNIIKTTFHATFRPFHLLWFIHNKERKVINLYVHVTVHRNKFLFHKTNKKHEFPKFYFVKKKTLHVSDISFAHQQESSTVHSTLVYFLQVWWQLPSGVRMKCPNHAEFFDKIKFVINSCVLMVLLKRSVRCSFKIHIKLTMKLLLLACFQFILIICVIPSNWIVSSCNTSYILWDKGRLT